VEHKSFLKFVVDFAEVPDGVNATQIPPHVSLEVPSPAVGPIDPAVAWVNVSRMPPVVEIDVKELGEVPALHGPFWHPKKATIKSPLTVVVWLVITKEFAPDAPPVLSDI
jgi:hypothetical protein